MRRQCQAVYYAFDILWLNGRDLRNLSLLERKKILRSAIPRKSACVGYVSYVDRQAMKLFEMIKKGDLEGLARISHNVARERQRKAREASITMRWNAGWWAQQKIES
jgi:hypothetical protein